MLWAFASERFNPHPREGGDPTPLSRPPRTQRFNPHPREGGDLTPVADRQRMPSFNPHPREGGDHRRRSSASSSPGFNPHPREGGDGQGEDARDVKRGFNPHPREGGDRFARPTRHGANVSIHTPVKGVTVAVLSLFLTRSCNVVIANLRKSSTRSGLDDYWRSLSTCQ